MKKLIPLLLIFFAFISCSKPHRTFDGGSSGDSSGSSAFDEFFADYQVPTITLDDLRNMSEFQVNGFMIFPSTMGETSNLLSGVGVSVKFHFDFLYNDMDDYGIPVLMEIFGSNGGEYYAVGFFKDGMLRMAKATSIYAHQYDAIDYLKGMLFWFEIDDNIYGLSSYAYWFDDEDSEKREKIFEAKIDNWAHIAGVANYDGVQRIVELEYVAPSDKNEQPPVIKYVADNGYKLEMQYFRPFKENKLNAKAIISSTLSDGEMSEANIVSVIDENNTFAFDPQYCDFGGVGKWSRNKIIINTPNQGAIDFLREN